MSLARAFTTRRAKHTIDVKEANSGIIPQRSNTTAKGHGRGLSIRNMISGPMELTHTTNMLAYNAPDLHPKSASSTTSFKVSDDESDSAHTNASSPPTSPDVASADERSISPEPNHLSCYFMAPGQKLPNGETPKIPSRAPSHTKKASYEHLAQKQQTQQVTHMSYSSGKSVSTKASFSSFRISSASTAASSVHSGIYTHSSKPPSVPALPSQPTAPSVSARQMSTRRHEGPSTHHPFGQELAQVSEIAEEFGVKEKVKVADDEEQWLISKGLSIFKADDYLSEVQVLFSTFFKQEARAAHQVLQPVWI